METSNTNINKEYIYLDGMLVAFRYSGQTFYVFNDASSRPQNVTNGSGTRKWQADNHAFGRSIKVDNVGSLNIGYPGQYYDSQTQTWYNHFRDYDENTGRYLQSDPKGVIDGPNTYLYTGNNPVNRVDPTGEVWGLIFAVADIGYTLYESGGDFSKIDPVEVLASAALGTAGKVLYRAIKNSKRLERVAQNMRQKDVVDDDVLENAPYKDRRPYTRRTTERNAWDNAQDGSQPNSKSCPDCGKDVFGNPYNKELRNTPEGWDVEHVEKWEKIRRALQKRGASASEYRDAYNDLENTILRCRSCNRSDNQL